MSSYRDHGISLSLYDTGIHYQRCPSCSDGRKSANKNKKCLRINADLSVWKCYHCGFSGSLKREASNVQVERKYIKPTYTPPTPKKSIIKDGVIDILSMQPGELSGLPPNIVKYFSDRKITEDILCDFKIGAEDHYFAEAGRSLQSICFPYEEDGEIIDVKYRSRLKDQRLFALEAGAKRGLYNAWGVSLLEDYLIWVEGEIDVLSIVQCGYQNAVSPPMGAPGSRDKTVDGKLPFWPDYQELFDQFSRHIIAVDADAPGRRLADELVLRLGPERCYTVQWPEDCKDANDVLVKHGVEALTDLIDNAQPVPISGLFSVESQEKRIIDLYEGTQQRGLSTGWPSLDPYYLIARGEFTTVTGIPSMGKSTWMNALMVQMAMLHDWKFIVFSPESGSISRHIGKLCAAYSGKAFFPFWGESARMTKSELKEAMAWVDKHFVFIRMDAEQRSQAAVLEKCKAQILRSGADGILFDPFNEFDHSYDGFFSETLYIASFLGKQRAFCEKYNLHMWTVVHPRNMEAQIVDGSTVYQVPTGNHINGGANWRNKSDALIVVHRPNPPESESTAVNIYVQKVRNEENGKPGVATLEFDQRCGRYY